MAGFSAATTTAKGFEATNKNKKGKSGKPQVAASLRTLAVALQSYGKEKGPGAQRGWEKRQNLELGMVWILCLDNFGYVWISLPQSDWSCFEVVPAHEPSPCDP